VLSLAKKLKPLNIFRSIFPEQCVVCHGTASTCVCQACALQCPSEFTVKNTVTTLSDYHESLLKELLHEIKFNCNRRVAEWLGNYLKEHVMKVPYRDSVWVPVPSHSNRLVKRGFDHLSVILEPLLKSQGVLLQPIIQRIKDTPPLHHLSRQERQLILRDVFAWSFLMQPQLLMNNDVVIVDDIYTTGATVFALQALIMTYPVRSCRVVTLAVTQP